RIIRPPGLQLHSKIRTASINAGFKKRNVKNSYLVNLFQCFLENQERYCTTCFICKLHLLYQSLAKLQPNLLFYETALSPVTPTTITATLTMRKICFESPNKSIFKSTAPAVPAPIKTV